MFHLSQSEISSKQNLILETKPVKLFVLLKTSLLYQFLHSFRPRALQFFLKEFTCFSKTHSTEQNSRNPLKMGRTSSLSIYCMKSCDDKGTLMTVFTSPEFCFLIDNPTPRELNSIYQITSRCPDVTFIDKIKETNQMQGRVHLKHILGN
jgi:hypothetical protein